MMRVILAGVLLLTLAAGLTQATPADLARDLAAQADGARIHADVARLADNEATAPRPAGSLALGEARDLVEDRLRGLGLEVRRLPHRCVLADGAEVGAESVLALVQGRDRAAWAVVGAHLDTVEGSPGALDNAAGVAIVLEVARVLSARSSALEGSVLLALWDCEEPGLWGSRAVAEAPGPVGAMFGLAAPPAVRAALSLDMAGLNWPAGDAWLTHNPGSFTPLHVLTAPPEPGAPYDPAAFDASEKAAFAAFRGQVEEALHGTLAYPRLWVQVRDDDHGRSDHVPFVEAGVPGLRMMGPIDDAYPHYHRPGDTLAALEQAAHGPERLQEGLAAAARATLAIVVHALGEATPPPEPEPRPVPLEGGLALLGLAGAAVRRRARAGMPPR
jgi:MYXO-CTERM domain-containing protein